MRVKRSRPLKPGIRVEYRDGHGLGGGDGRRGVIVRRCSTQGMTYQYWVEVTECPDTWKPEWKAQQVGKLQGWWDCDFTVIK